MILAIDGASPALSVAVASDDGELIADVSWTTPCSCALASARTGTT